MTNADQRIRELEDALIEALDGWQGRVNSTRRHHPAGLGHHPEDADEDDQIAKLSRLVPRRMEI